MRAQICGSPAGRASVGSRWRRGRDTSLTRAAPAGLLSALFPSLRFCSWNINHVPQRGPRGPWCQSAPGRRARPRTPGSSRRSAEGLGGAPTGSHGPCEPHEGPALHRRWPAPVFGAYHVFYALMRLEARWTLCRKTAPRSRTRLLVQQGGLERGRGGGRALCPRRLGGWRWHWRLGAGPGHRQAPRTC